MASSCFDWDGVDLTAGSLTFGVLDQGGLWRQTLSKLEDSGS